MSNQFVSRKKQHERFLLERFISAAKILVEIKEEREGPDFIVFYEGRSIGVEVVELYRSTNSSSLVLQAQESISNRIVSDAQKIYQNNGAPAAHVSVLFSSGSDLRPLNRKKTACDLASFIQRLNLIVGQSFKWRNFQDDDVSLPNEISFIQALGVPSYSMAHWSVSRAGWVAPLEERLLQEIIDNKEKRLLDYQSIVQENWLLIVSNKSKPSQMFDHKGLEAQRIISPFSRTFYYGYPENAFIELGDSKKLVPPLV